MTDTREVFVYMDGCGDPECDCYWPVAEVRSTVRYCEYGWKPPVTLATGPHIAYGYGGYDSEDEAEQENWMREARAWYFLPTPTKSSPDSKDGGIKGEFK